ncbi:MAG TPA: hypothetical protein PLP34_02895 [Chitinophagaceae bacterium]|nr:hypothetical protein [Chitinophagaceae bacterium]HNF71332.1 hypothetical protein [Chitinophagaceae bacterium]
MKTPFVRMALAFTLLSTVLYLSSCNRRDKDKDTDTQLASDFSFSENTYNDVLNIADNASETASGDHLSSYKTSSNCATVTHDTISIPHTITIDFGSTNCLCNDGRNRRGKILVSYTGHYRDSGSVHTITFDNYFVNDNHIMGSKSVSNMGHNAAGQTYFQVNVNGLVVKALTGDSISWTSTRTRTWTQGESTIGDKTDDVYEITGSASGTKGSTSYTMTIVQPLVKALSCGYISKGIMEIQPSGKLLRSIDFGNGTCDNTAQVTIGGNVYTITLH